MGRAPHGARGLKWNPTVRGAPGRGSRPARGAWIEIYMYPSPWSGSRRRAPHGARGLKYGGSRGRQGQEQSRPARGAWIEMTPSSRPVWSRKGRAPHGARGLKSRDGLGDGVDRLVAPRTGRVD